MTLHCATCLNVVERDPATTCPVTDEPHRLLTCPATTTTSTGEAHTIVGCGSSNLQRDDGEPHLFDCLDCGIFFDPTHEPATEAT